MKHLKYIIWILLVVLSAACEQLPFTEVTLKKQTVEVFDNNSVVLEVEFNPTAVVIQSVEVYYSTNSDMSHIVVCAMECNDTLAYKVKLTDLQRNTTYYVRYIVSNPVSTWVVTAAPFTTKTSSATPDDGTESGHEYVDLGLSVKWATCNVGATKPEEYGDYFAWGETDPKNTYDWSNYKWCNGSSSSLTKYNNKSSYGTVDYKITLDLSDDAAAVNWGGDWRMPTDAEWTELRKQCTWTWITQNGVKGYRVTGTNGNSIFFPVAGYRLTSDLVNAGSSGYYWSSSLDPDDPDDAYELGFNSGYVGRVGISRYYGHSVRPVYGAQVAAPTVVTSTVTQIEETTAVAGGNATSDGGASVTERGVVYSTSSNPTTANSKVASGNGTGSFTCNLTGLQPNTTYYVRAYAVNSKGTSYGEEVSFTTNEKVFATPEYVDLGLSVKWATFNVGATKPEEYGDYFAWGETEPKSTYDWSTYSEASDDVAAVKWGGSWRMPTQTEQDELRTQCTWTWTSQNGVKGYRVTGTNGNSIFLPAAGYRSGSSLYNADSKGFYWSSSLYSGSANYAYYVSFTSFDVSRYSNDRCYGQSVRPVYGPQITAPNVVTSNVTQITETTAVVGGNVTSDGGASVTERGVVYATTANPTTSNSKLTSGSGTGSFTCNLTGLQPNTTYYVRAYAVNSKGTSYGEQVSFTTKEKPNTGTENGHGYVDLGLSIKWATMNVGASKPEDYGDYFAWGETESKNNYSSETYKWGNGSTLALTKYCTLSNNGHNGFTDNKTTLDYLDDVVSINWGGTWRTPTKAEFDELCNYCTWKWTSLSGIAGYLVTSNKSGYTDKFIFLPAAGYRHSNSLYDVGKGGNYWSCSLCANSPQTAHDLYFYPTHWRMGTIYRIYGLPIRPVCQ